MVKIYRDVLEKRVDPAIDELQKLRKPYHKKKGPGIIKTLAVSALVAYSSYNFGKDIFYKSPNQSYAAQSTQQQEEVVKKQDEKPEIYILAVADSVEDKPSSENTGLEYIAFEEKAIMQKRDIGKPRFPERYYKVNQAVIHKPSIEYNKKAMGNLEFIVDDIGISINISNVDITGKKDKEQWENWIHCTPSNHSDIVLRVNMLDKSSIILYSDKSGITDVIDPKYLKIENGKIGFDDSVLALYVGYLKKDYRKANPTLHIIGKKFL